MTQQPVVDRATKVVVELAGTIKSSGWMERHRRGEVADLSPYGLHRLREHGVDVWLRDSSEQAWRNRFDGVLLHHTGRAWGQTLLPSQRAPWRPDLLLAWNERGGIPAIVREHVMGRRVPVVTGIIWETESPSGADSRWLSKAASIFLLSTGQIPAVRLLLGGRGPRPEYVPFGIDTEYFASRRAELGSDPIRPDVDELLQRHPVVMSVGNDLSRDYSTLIKAMSRLQEEPATRSLRLLLATRRPTKVPPKMGIQVGNLDAKHVRSALRQAAVFVVTTRPNLHVSGVTAVLEAMSVGMPVVASRTPGMSDYVRDGETGFLVDCGDEEGIVSAVRALIADPARACAMGVAAAEHVRAHHDVAHMQGRLARLIHRL